MLCFIGTTELILLGGLALLLFGGKKLPEMMRGLGKGVREFKEGIKETTGTSTEESELRKNDSSKSVSSKDCENDCFTNEL